MIRIEPYKDAFEKEYLRCVEEVVSDETKKRIIDNCVKILPTDFFENNKRDFQYLVLAPYSKLKKAQKHIMTLSNKEMKRIFFLMKKQEGMKEIKFL